MPWIEISQAAFTMGISERTLRNWIKSGKINAKTENGRRLVEIPEDEYRADSEPRTGASGEHLKDEYNQEGGTLDTQKRLEVALLECGRVKGTLASQERIMETLSSNIAELTAKLQKSQNSAWKLILACAIVAGIGVLAVVMRGSYYHEKMLEVTKQHIEEGDKLNKTIAEGKDNLNAEKLRNEKLKSELRDKYEQKLKLEIAALEEKQARLYKENMSEMKQEFRDMLSKNEKTIKEQRQQLAQKNNELLKTTQLNQQVIEERDRLQRKLEEQARLLEDFDRLKKQYRELESELIESRRKSLRR